MDYRHISKHDYIPTEEIRQDISDTLNEISTMYREEEAFRMLGDRLSVMKADHRLGGIRRRKEFIIKLENILKDRGEKIIEV